MHRSGLWSSRRAIAALLGAGVLAGAAACATSATATSAPPREASAPAASRNVSPDAPLTPAQRRWVDSTLATLSLRDRVAQMVWEWVLGDYTNAHDSSFAQVADWVQHEHIGGITMSLGSPIEVAAKVNALQRLAPVPLLVSSDVEPGLGRLEGGVFAPSLLRGGSATVLPSNMAIGADGSAEDAYEAGRITGEEARAIGITVAFAPVVDVNNNPANPVINIRSFGEDPHAVARLATAFIRGVQDEGVAATAKHFPGHGDTDTDSHLALPFVHSDMARLDSVELVPFRAAIDAGVGLVMTAHIALPAIEPDSTPATLSPRVVTGLLRDSLHFRGISVTDALSMEAIGKGYPIEVSSVLAVKAGADILLKPTDPVKAIDAVVAAVQRGEIAPERIERSARRILEMKARTGIAFRRYADLAALREVVGSPAHWAAADSIAARAVTLLRDSASLVPAAGRSLAVVTYAPELDILGGRSFVAALRAQGAPVRSTRISPRTPRAELDSIADALAGADRLIITTHVRTAEGQGRFAIAPAVAAWIDSLAQARPVIVVAYGNPYVLGQFPHVTSYLATYGMGDALEQAAARAILGRAPITGRAPISLPGLFARGDGLTRSSVVSQQGGAR